MPDKFNKCGDLITPDDRITSLLAFKIIFLPLTPPLRYSTPVAVLFSIIIFVTNASVIISRFSLDLTGFKKALDALTLNLPFVVLCTYETPS